MSYWDTEEDDQKPWIDIFSLYTNRFRTMFKCDRVWDTRANCFVSFRDALASSADEYHQAKSYQFRTEVMLRCARDWFKNRTLPSRFVPEHLVDREACTYDQHQWGVVIKAGEVKIICLDPCDEPICREVHGGYGGAYQMEVSACLEPLEIDLCDTVEALPVSVKAWSETYGGLVSEAEYEWGFELRAAYRKEGDNEEAGELPAVREGVHGSLRAVSNG